jgi:AcrR family transcriptional regulator
MYNMVLQTGRPVRSRRQTPLTEAEIVGAALRVLQRYGVAGLTMRALADELGVSAMAPYYHVGSRDDLLARVADALMRRVEPPRDTNEPWEDRLWRYMRSMEDVLSAYPGLSDFLLHRDLTTEGRRYMSRCITIIEAGGFDRAPATQAFTTIYTYMWGRGVFRSLLRASERPARRGRRRSAGGLPTVEELASPEATELGYRTIIAGLQIVRS